MRAIVVDRWTTPADLRVADVPAPATRPDGLLVDVRAAGCNFADILVIAGKYQVKPPLPFVPGVELSGVVHAAGDAVRGFGPGDRVLAHVPFGAYAEQACVPAALAFRVPAGMSFEEAAAFPIVYPTSHAALVLRAALRAGETLLVHAAAGGVGYAAVQIGKALGARVIATAGGTDKLAVARRAGADEALDYRSDDWAEQVRALTGGRGADVIYDPVGGDTFDQSLRCIAWNGRLLVIGFASGRIPEVRLNRVLLKNVAIVGLHWTAYAEREPARIAETMAALFALHERGAVTPFIQRTYPLEELPAALAALGARETVGKLVITP